MHAAKAGTRAGVMRGNFVWEAQMKLDEVHVHYKVHEESLQYAPNWFGSKYQALKHSTTHTVTCGAAFPKFASTKLRHASTKLRHFRSRGLVVTFKP